MSGFWRENPLARCDRPRSLDCLAIRLIGPVVFDGIMTRDTNHHLDSTVVSVSQIHEVVVVADTNLVCYWLLHVCYLRFAWHRKLSLLAGASQMRRTPHLGQLQSGVAELVREVA